MPDSDRGMEGAGTVAPGADAAAAGCWAGATGGAGRGAARCSCAPPGDGCRCRRVAVCPEDPWPTSTAPPPSLATGACEATVPDGGVGAASTGADATTGEEVATA